jgi:hypothetical protein
MKIYFKSKVSFLLLKNKLLLRRVLIDSIIGFPVITTRT